MPIISIREIGAALEAKLPQLQAALASGLGFAEVERALQETMAQLTATMLERLLSFVDAGAWFCSPTQAVWGSARDAAEGVSAGAATAGLGAGDQSQRAVLYQSGPAAWAAQAGSERTGGVSGFGRL
jgi:hypothetical protein